MKNLVIIVLAAVVMLAAPVDAQTVKITGVVQDRDNLTPLADVTDTLTFAVQVLIKDTDKGAVGLTVQRLDSGDYIAGFNLNLSLGDIVTLVPYIAVGLAVNVNNISDDGSILTGDFGVWKPLTEKFGVFVEARSLTWFVGDRDTVVGAGAGITVAF